MAKKMICKSAPEIELCIDGGDSVLLRFDVQCMTELQELEGGFKALFKMKMSEQAAQLVYAAGKNHNENFTIDEARKMVACMDLASVSEILKTFSESVGSTSGVSDDMTKKILAQMLLK
jgi:hypothetical protein